RLVEAVDVLRDEELDAPGAGQVGERRVRSVGFGRPDELPGLALVTPVRLARALAGEELGQRHGLVAFPAPAGRAEVGDAGGRREPRAGQHDDAAGPAPRVGERSSRSHSVARQAGHDALDLAQERPHGIRAGEAREAHLAQVIEDAGVVLEAHRQLAVELAAARLPLGERARTSVGTGALLEVVAEVAAPLDEGPE